jgi:hypothetical protein
LFGLTVEEASGPPVEVWPENLDAVNTFIGMATQWRPSFGGVIGLDYAALPAVLDLLGIKRKKRGAVFDALRVMEDAALEVIRESVDKRGK